MSYFSRNSLYNWPFSFPFSYLFYRYFLSFSSNSMIRSSFWFILITWCFFARLLCNTLLINKVNDMKNKTISPITKQVYINVKILLSNKFIQHSHPLLFILSHNSQNFKVIDKYKKSIFYRCSFSLLNT